MTVEETTDKYLEHEVMTVEKATDKYLEHEVMTVEEYLEHEVMTVEETTDKYLEHEVMTVEETTDKYLEHEDGESWFDRAQFPAFVLEKHPQLVEFRSVITAEVVKALAAYRLFQTLRLGT